MSAKLICKIMIDILMLGTMPVLMAYMLAGEKLHEWLGAGIFVLFILHHILNFQWIKNIFYRKYTILSSIKTIVNSLILCMLIGLAYSGIVLSHHIFVDLNIHASRALARKIHMFCSYWGFALMSLHFGFHWNMFLGIAKKLIKKTSVIRSSIAKILTAGITGYGIYAFQKREIGFYMLMKIQFAFFDVQEPLCVFILDYFAIMGLFAIIGYYTIKLIQKKGRVISK